MKGDFSRNTYSPLHHFTRVLMQQGRVQLDADWNEQTSILLHYLRSLTADLIGRHGGPEHNLGFKIDAPSPETELDFSISQGHYYVDGLLCVNEQEDLSYTVQQCDDEELGNKSYLVYLDVWERHVTHLETDYSIREVALNGPDTATRAQLVFQVKVLSSYEDGGERIDVPEGLKGDNDDDDKEIADEFCADWLTYQWESQRRRGYLAAMLAEENDDDDACIISPESRYRGLENQLYRVEIHQSGPVGEATFKFSRDNGSVIFPLAREVAGKTIYLEHLGKDSRFGLQKGDWVEVVDDMVTLRQAAEPLLRVEEVDPVGRSVTLSGTPTAGTDTTLHPFLRRWDHKAKEDEEPDETLEDGAVLIGALDTVYELEDGIVIKFRSSATADSDESGAEMPEPVFRTGDYWLIPARVATGRIEWPQVDSENAKSLPPHGVDHHYAPLAIITFSSGKLSSGDIIPCQKMFIALTESGGAAGE